MPTRGYRKGISDTKTAAPKRVHTRLPARTHAALIADSISRHCTASAILRALVVAYYTSSRVDLPQARGPSSAAIRELTRIGNNLNQLTREAHTMRLHLLEQDVRRCLALVAEVVRRL
jgi:hypothetical protein